MHGALLSRMLGRHGLHVYGRAYFPTSWTGLRVALEEDEAAKRKKDPYITDLPLHSVEDSDEEESDDSRTGDTSEGKKSRYVHVGISETRVPSLHTGAVAVAPVVVLYSFGVREFSGKESTDAPIHAC